MKEYTTLEKVALIYNGNSINAEYKKQHFVGLKTGYPFIGTKDVSFEGVVDYNNGVRIPYNTDYKTAEPDSVFICAEGGSAGRKIAYINEKVCFGNKLFCIKPKKNIYIGKFLYYYLMSNAFQTQFKLMLTGLIGGVSAKKFKSFTIPILEITEQERIVAFLDAEFEKIDQLKANAAVQLQAAKDLFQAALKEMLPPKEGWTEKTLKEIGKTQTGCTPSMSCREYYNEDYIPFVKPSEINSNGLGGINYNTQMLSKKGAEVGRIFEKDSIFMVCIGATIGKLGISDQRISCNQQINVLTPNEGYCNKFIYYAMLDTRFNNIVIEEGKSSQATLPIISKGKWEALKLYTPQYSEQEQITKVLDDISIRVKALQSNYNQTLTLCNDLKQALLKSIFA